MQSVELSGLVAAKPFLITQDYAKYTPDQHTLWSELVARRMAQLVAWGVDGLCTDRPDVAAAVIKKASAAF